MVALDDVTTLTFSATGPFGSVEGSGPTTGVRTLPSGDTVDAAVDTNLDVSAFVHQKVRAVAAHRSQYPIDPDVFPPRLLQEMFGAEYFLQVLPERKMNTSLLDTSGDRRADD